ncbi:HD domain-containing protein [Piscinibacter koreensis]|uniref:Uncharacterized protein n=1 Tax=Piscinibacter koreensis TaxID=2742824 RepID=A0A7Y6NN34_9BURK|nr:hypothetical protein [Schlegelella koreensis]NUZ06112.1 hypothetical protein [Schlegelella koreensis]
MTHHAPVPLRRTARPSLATRGLDERPGAQAWVMPLLSDAEAEASWETIWGMSGQQPPVAIKADLLDAWAQPHRHCHGMRHLRECLSLWSAWVEHCQRADEVGLALWFSGAVCSPRSGDNASRNATWAARALAATPTSFERTQRIHDLVLAAGGSRQVLHPDADLIADIALAHLGSPAQRFAARELELRRERPWLGRAAYRLQRVAVLQHLLAEPRIFRTDVAWSLLERQARANLAMACERLAA